MYRYIDILTFIQKSFYIVHISASAFYLLQQVHYHAHSYGGKTRTVKNVLFEKKQGKIAGGGTDVWRDEKMPIPPVPPSYLLGCKIIDIRYLLMVSKIYPGPKVIKRDSCPSQLRLN